jgi:hypothetical protein
MVEFSDMPNAVPATNAGIHTAPTTQNIQSCGVKLKTTDGAVDINEVRNHAQG